MSQSPIIVALDFDHIDQARQLVKQVSPELCRLKVGKQMFTAYGPHWVEELVGLGFDVFLDLKFHDIPNTVAHACQSACNLGVWMLNVHASGGLSMMQAAREAVGHFGDSKPLLIAVTVLTSMTHVDLKPLASELSLEQMVINLALSAQQAGLDGVVCSAQEVALLRQHIDDAFCLVTPGIRLKDTDDDQQRVMTPSQAMQAGSDYLVIGRPITKSEHPAATLEHILQQL